ncbi:hypothetical protein BAMA_13770 [Bacillus manliponensis]|uniref:Group-specific protein n=1 Tax=Bacillus manliponensis TaxID=574376 RepID=A0A073JZL9_9BACI|nr:hypothetical protein [Bacillus manliponensis]KEK20484.1 hypothetical protein BAMA_13770 [Bacillus manliponensis]
MKLFSSIRFWNLFMSFIIFGCALFVIGKYNQPKAAKVNDIPPYEMIYTKPNHILPTLSTEKERVVLKGMLTTDASSYEQLYAIAKHIQGSYKGKQFDTIELTIHNNNNGQYEELPYEPISKGNIVIHYTTHTNARDNIILQLNNRP